jgi:peptidyl-prolyl cis-trans isomerase B (cyclophilin B)
MSKLPRLRFIVAGVAIATVTTLLMACGGDDKPLASGGPSPTPGVASDASCSGGKLASIKRDGTRAFKAAPDLIIDPAKTYTALMKTSKGDISLSLAAKDAPTTVNNFVVLSCGGYYDGLSFHRIVREPQPFVIQGGDPRGDGSGGPGYIFNDEISPNLKHDAAGVLAMANAGPNTNGSQFYITLSPQTALDGKYNVFGRVTDGMNSVNNIQRGDKILSVSVTEQ